MREQSEAIKAEKDDEADKDNPCWLVVHDALQPCPYLRDTQARMPLRWPMGPITAETLDDLLQRGYRRSGGFVYRTQCPSCQACQPVRLIAPQFPISGSYRRVLSRGDRQLDMRIAVPTVDAQRLSLFNRHRIDRGLAHDPDPLDHEDYGSFLIDTCCRTLEFSFWRQESLVAVATADVGITSVSAVYTFFDPDLRKLSLGTYAILKQLEYACQSGRRFLYLGMYVAPNRHLNYKARFLPQQRRIDGHWLDFPRE